MFIKLTLDDDREALFNVNHITEILPSPHPDDKHQSVVVLNDTYSARQVKEDFQTIIEILGRAENV